ncbi:sialic acid-binding Ig-like lectin 13 isoform X2 [Xiphias gladius]|uniref:sialic acid-binding Ig-like lectin 13 isoform X2 n=1 Tax=Xiphias gladius TaxID=8245 RepID=UPI001A98B5D1|nr:sialic acid-binding Ig-like lectin 13 isoform X2 [Xiphias gladius]
MESWILMILVTMPGVWSGDWSVTFENQCALKGSSVVIKCSYDYPSGHFVTSVDWSKARYASGRWMLFPLSRLLSPQDHFKYVGNLNGNCNLEINDVRHTDEGAYFFSFVTTFNRWTSKTSARLYVKELTTVVQPSTVTEGDNVSLTCVSGCPTPTIVVWFRDGQPVLKPVFQARREDAGRYYCAVLGQETVRSASVALNIQYLPINIFVSVDPPQVAEGSSVNLTCSSVANPAADSYTWYMRAVSSSGSSPVLQVGSGQVLSLPSVEASHAGLYLCQARNSVGENNSTEVLLTMTGKAHGTQPLSIVAGVGAFLFVTVVIALLLHRRKQRPHAEDKTVFHSRLIGRGSRSSAKKDQFDNDYATIHTFPSSPSLVPVAQDIANHSRRNSHHEHDAPTSYEPEVTYSTVTIKPRNPSFPHHINNSRAPQGSWSKAGEPKDFVIYATVAKSSGSTA